MTRVKGLAERNILIIEKYRLGKSYRDICRETGINRGIISGVITRALASGVLSRDNRHAVETRHR